MPTLLSTSAIVVIAAKAHGGQSDKLGQPTIFHVQRVADRVEDAGHGEVAIQIALLHDILEDGVRDSDQLLARDDTSPPRLIVAQDLLDGCVDPQVVAAVDILTRRDGEPYRAYIQRIATSRNRLAIVVKLDGDLEDHLDPAFADGLTPSLRGRYEAARTRLREALGALDHPEAHVVPRNLGPMPEPVYPPPGMAEPQTYPERYPEF